MFYYLNENLRLFERAMPKKRSRGGSSQGSDSSDPLVHVKDIEPDTEASKSPSPSPKRVTRDESPKPAGNAAGGGKLFRRVTATSSTSSSASSASSEEEEQAVTDQPGETGGGKTFERATSASSSNKEEQADQPGEVFGGYISSDGGSENEKSSEGLVDGGSENEKSSEGLVDGVNADFEPESDFEEAGSGAKDETGIQSSQNSENENDKSSDSGPEIYSTRDNKLEMHLPKQAARIAPAAPRAWCGKHTVFSSDDEDGEESGSVGETNIQLVELRMTPEGFLIFDIDRNRNPTGPIHAVTGISVRDDQMKSWPLKPEDAPKLQKIITKCEKIITTQQFRAEIPGVEKPMGKFVVEFKDLVPFKGLKLRCIIFDYNIVYQDVYKISSDGSNVVIPLENGNLHVHLTSLCGNVKTVYTKMFRFFISVEQGHAHAKQVHDFENHGAAVIHFLHAASPYVMSVVHTENVGNRKVNRITWYLRPGFVGIFFDRPVQKVIALSLIYDEVIESHMSHGLADEWKGVMKQDSLHPFPFPVNPTCVEIVGCWLKTFPKLVRPHNYEDERMFNGPFRSFEGTPEYEAAATFSETMTLYGILSGRGIRMGVYALSDKIVVRGEVLPALLAFFDKKVLKRFGLLGASSTEDREPYSYPFFRYLETFSDARKFISTFPRFADFYTRYLNCGRV
jgi:hypothetical protein